MPVIFSGNQIVKKREEHTVKWVDEKREVER